MLYVITLASNNNQRGSKSSTGKGRKFHRGPARVNQGSLATGPDSVKVKLVYFEAIEMDGLGSVGFWDYAFRLNSVYDPNFTATGHQPAGFDEWSALYSKYRVWGGSFKVHVANKDPLESLHFLAVPRSVNTTDSGLSSYAEEPRAHYMLAAARGSPTVSMSGTFSNPEILGVTRGEYEDQDYAALTSANPTTLTWLNLHAQMSSSEVATQVSECVIEIHYDVEFFSRNELDVSLKILPLIKEYETTGAQSTLVRINQSLVATHKRRSPPEARPPLLRDPKQ